MEFISYKQEGYIGTITINRPDALNALNSQVLDELRETFNNIDTDKTRVILIAGSGEKAFVAGADVAEMIDLNSIEGEKFSKKGNDLFRKIEMFPIPTIAVINGFALGGGCELALSCDIRLCSETAIFGQPEVGLGITPGFGGTQRLSRVVGLGKAKEMIFTGNFVKAKEAYEMGLVNHIYSKETLMEEALKMANKIAKNAPIAISKSKRIINDGLDTNMDRAIILEEKAFGSCFETEDRKEGMKGFLEKRKDVEFKNK
ncbi:MAG: enoyl-CoA hydratase/isomerase family protein [Fusobacterium sp.]|nr:enoyl-CoA hydratase/isomerase family protein [Fusobacterium sp.]